MTQRLHLIRQRARALGLDRQSATLDDYARLRREVDLEPHAAVEVRFVLRHLAAWQSVLH